MRHPAELDAYALGELDEIAACRVDVHLATCRRCRTEVSRLREGVVLAAAALEPVAPRRELRERTLAAARPHLQRARTEPGAGAGERTRPLRAGSWRPAALAVAVVLIVAAGALLIDSRRALDAIETERALVAAWLTREDVVRHAIPARAVGDRSPGSVMVAADGVVLVVLRAPPPAGHSYGVWGHGDDGSLELARTSGTVIRVDASGFHELGVSLDPGPYLGRVPLAATF